MRRRRMMMRRMMRRRRRANNIKKKQQKQQLQRQRPRVECAPFSIATERKACSKMQTHL
jgi:hypothetical protein